MIRVKQLRDFVSFTRVLVRQLRLITRTSTTEGTYIFHHIPKCGGTSWRRTINDCKNTYNDYRLSWSTIYPPRYNLFKLTQDDCLCGHFEPDLQPLSLRYPEVYSGKHKLISFVRDPLAIAISYSRYRSSERNEHRDVALDVANTRNYLSHYFQVTEENYRQVLDSYEFIGVLEFPKESMRALKSALRIERDLTLQKINSSGKQLLSLDNEFIKKFRERNELDYKIYNYCLNKLLENDV